MFYVSYTPLLPSLEIGFPKRRFRAKNAPYRNQISRGMVDACPGPVFQEIRVNRCCARQTSSIPHIIEKVIEEKHVCVCMYVYIYILRPPLRFLAPPRQNALQVCNNIIQSYVCIKLLWGGFDRHYEYSKCQQVCQSAPWGQSIRNIVLV